ncbi:hypothetical protein DV738_g1891, partial [Chaetothyriales sp. CBS 135597]
MLNTSASREATVLLFGGHVLSQTKDSLDKLIRPLVDGPNANWITATVAGLPQYWDGLTKKIPEIDGTIPGTALLADLDSWLRNGPQSEEQPDADLPNVVVGPLMVAIQLNQYWRYLELQQIGRGQNPENIDLQADLVARQRQTKQPVETLGFCAGLIAALAVASSSNRQDFEKYGAAAVRLGMLIGALIDAREAWDKGRGQGQSVSYATGWRTQQQADEMARIISALEPDTYVAVLYDEARSTVTTSERTAPALVRQLRKVGVTAVDLGIQGHIHTPGLERKRHTDALVQLCSEMPGLQFADPASLVLPTYDNEGQGKPVLPERGNLVEMALRSILTQQCNWYGTFSKAVASKEDPYVVAFGLDRCIPPTLMRRLGEKQLTHKEGAEATSKPRPAGQQRTKDRTAAAKKIPPENDAIVVVGMSVKVAGADDLEEFAEMLKTGESQHELITRDRLMFDYLFRDSMDADPKRKFYGNFMRDADAFDHKFFKRSPRESQAIDPQSRLCLQAAYQAIEQSGYFAETSTTTVDGRDKLHVGVYLGNCGVDYEHNITCHAPTAFTATGGLKSFIVGRLSHYFGWTGPSMTFDTACSSSAVAVHTACRDLLSGDCSSALCGGVNIMTNMLWLQNLAAGSFLSPTGQCKPFDEGADGYCRAEGMAFVYLKRLSDAIADGNPVLATIMATGVYQNQNCTPLFVPNVPSLSQLFVDIVHKAGVDPRDISLVEAHGTGTPVGDPAEYESVRRVLGGPIRDKKLPLGSVKGHIGHTEGASGLIALVKVIMMMRDGFIPPQASFKKLNHHIEVRPDDMMEVPTSLRPWEEEHKVALINNYGACGSNASIVVAQSPFSQPQQQIQSQGIAKSSRWPFWITGLDARSIAAYCTKLLAYLQSHSGDEQVTLADLSFNLNRQCNRGLPQGLIFSCTSIAELESKLKPAAEASSPGVATGGITPVKPARPVILCFGGQVSTFVGLDRKLYDSVAVLRLHLDECDRVIKSLGHASIYPDIFSHEPQQDPVRLQTMLFATQYASAKTWIDCGLAVAAVVGHSFGEITALSVAGVLSLHDTVRLVAGRAALVREDWGADTGSMIAVEADESLVNELLNEANRASDGSASIACYNGPRSFTLAGSTQAVDAVAEVLRRGKFVSIKSKRLNVTNAFHSVLVDRVVDGLDQLGQMLDFQEPAIPLERATEQSSPSTIDWTFVSSHMRKPVFFNHALQRLAHRHPQAIFLEAGSSSTITVMAARALAQTSVAPDAHYFQAMSITNDKGFDGLVDATVSLWKQGLRVSFWAHHPVQARAYSQLLLPPYQFDTSGRHWLKMKTLDLFTFVGYQDKKNKKPRFRVNRESDKYSYYFSGHVIAQTAPICPATLESDMAIEALFSLHPAWKTEGLLPVVHDLVNHSPICADASRVVYIDYAPLEASMQWAVTMLSVNAASNSDVQKHVELRLHVRSPTDPDYIQEFGRYERLVTHARCQALLGLDLDDDGVDVLQGRNVYRAFSPVVDYPELYRGVRCVVGRGFESAGVVRKRHQGKTWLDVPLSDSCSQVGGLWVNLMTDLPPGEMYIATGCDVSMRSPHVRTPTEGHENGPGLWHVLAQHSRQNEKEYTTDLFVFDAETGTLTDAMLGVHYGRVAKASMSKMLARLTKDESVLRINPLAAPASAPAAKIVPTPALPVPVDASTPAVTKPPNRKKDRVKNTKAAKRDITEEVRNLVANVSGIEASEMTLDSEMADLGIDSLMGMELGREVEIVFKCTLDQNEQMEATSLRKFVTCVSNALERAGVDSGEGGSGDDNGNPSNDDTDSSEDDDDTDSSDDLWSKPGQSRSSLTSSSSSSPTPEEKEVPSQAISVAAAPDLSLNPFDILQSFGEVKVLTDDSIRAHKIDSTSKTLIAGSNRLCAALVVEAMEELGMPIRSAAPGQPLARVPFLPQHSRLMACVYEFLEHEARLIDIDVVSGELTRTHAPAPRKSSQEVLNEVLAAHPGFAVPNRLTYYAGKSLAGVLSGQTDGIRVIFGTPEGRELVAAMYCEHTFNRMNYLQMREVIERLAAKLKKTQPEGAVLKVLEMGAGTGGTTLVIAPFLAELGIPVEYTFTDLSPSMVANARRKFGKQYPFMRFAVHDIEKPPAEEHKGQHIVLASNAIHATHNLVVSATNVRQALRPDGFLMLLEMTEVVPFIDLVFGLLEGWWLFDDGRTHAVVPAEHWERELHTAGYGHVDWTDGYLPENAFQKVIIALASGEPQARLPKAPPSEKQNDKEFDRGNVAAREAEAESLVAKYTHGWATSELDIQFAERPDVATVVCINRVSSEPVTKRQAEAFSSRGIQLSASASAKLRVLETDTSKPWLGLPPAEYTWLVQHGTHIVHNAWPMSGTRPIKAFEPQLQALRNLLDLARDMATTRKDADASNKVRIGFQFVSSIGVVGFAGQPRVLEQRVPISAVLPGGYTEAKWAGERMLEETLHKYPHLFRPMVVRPGQISGSTSSGVWNPVEHFAGLVKSAQSLRAWPDFDGVLQWLPVDVCARAMTELLLQIGVYHLDNPVGQPWKDMSPVLAAALDIPPHAIIPLKQWILRVRRSPLPETENPAVRLADFLHDHFERMSCGGLILDTTHAQQHSETMARQGPVSAEIAQRYVAAWKKMGFLNP